MGKLDSNHLFFEKVQSWTLRPSFIEQGSPWFPILEGIGAWTEAHKDEARIRHLILLLSVIDILADPGWFT